MKKEDGKKRKELPIKKEDEPNFEQKKRAVYSVMGKLGGLARAKQMTEKGFTMDKEIIKNPKSVNNNKKSS